MLGKFELYYPIVMSFVWIIGSFFFNLSERHFFKNPDGVEDDGPGVDVIMSCFNEEAVLEKSVRSLEQISYRNFHVVLVDDKSTDGTLDIMRRLAMEYSNVVVMTQPVNRGKAAALNPALKESTAEYILCVDADTTFEEQSLSRLVAAIGADNRIAAVTGRPVVKNVKTLVGKLQYLEYVMNIDMIKRAQSFFLGHILTVSGVLTLFRPRLGVGVPKR